MCQLDRSTRCADIWLNIISECLWGCFWVRWASEWADWAKADGPPGCGRPRTTRWGPERNTRQRRRQGGWASLRLAARARPWAPSCLTLTYPVGSPGSQGCAPVSRAYSVPTAERGAAQPPRQWQPVPHNTFSPSLPAFLYNRLAVSRENPRTHSNKKVVRLI